MPEDMPFELGAITEPIAVSLHGVKQLDLRKGEDILISGNGLLESMLPWLQNFLVQEELL